MPKKPTDTLEKRGVGRPKKSELKPKRPVGRPPGTQAVFNEYRDRLLASPKSRKVLDTLLDVATDPEHKHYVGAVKLVVERLMPKDQFEKDKLAGNKSRIEITINSPNSITAREAEDIDDVEYDDVSGDSDD